MSELVLYEETDIVKSKKLLADYQEANYTSKITAERGRLIRLIKKLIRKLRSNPNPTEKDIQKIEEAEDLLSDELFKHQIQLKERYKNEFIEKEAKVPDVVTTLPMGVALQTKRLANSINEVKNAKGVKGRSIALKNAFKDLGILVGTPIYFAGKFIIEHWYLLLLLWDMNRRKKKRDKQEEDKTKGREQPQEAPETVVEAELEKAKAAALAQNEEKEKGQVKEPELDPSPVYAADENSVVAPALSSARIPSPKIEQNEPVLGNAAETVLKAAVSSGRQPIAVPEKDVKPVVAAENTQVAPVSSSARTPVVKAEQNEPVLENAAETVLSSVTVDNPETLAELQKMDETCSQFIGDLEDRMNYNFFVASRHPDIKVVHSAEEFVEAATDNGVAVATVENAEDLYRSTLTLRPIDRHIVWPEIDPEMRFYENDATLAEHILSGEEPALTSFFDSYVESHPEQMKEATERVVDHITKENAEVVFKDGRYWIVDHTYGDPVMYPVNAAEAEKFKNTGVFSPSVGLGLSLFTIGPMSLPTFSFGGVPILVP